MGGPLGRLGAGEYLTPKALRVYPAEYGVRTLIATIDDADLT